MKIHWVLSALMLWLGVAGTATAEKIARKSGDADMNGSVNLSDYKATPKDFSGLVKKVESGRITVDAKIYALAGGAKLTINGTPAKWNDIRVGDSVEGKFIAQPNRAGIAGTATVFTARREKPAAATASLGTGAVEKPIPQPPSGSYNCGDGNMICPAPCHQMCGNSLGCCVWGRPYCCTVKTRSFVKWFALEK